MAKVGGGFPHSEIQGSKPVRGSPRLIAAYHVLHRLSAPRHPPDTLMTLDPLSSSMPTRQGSTDARPRPSHSTMVRPERPLLPNMSETTGGQARRHRAAPRAACLAAERRCSPVGPSSLAASASCACLAAGPSGRTHSLFTMSNNWLARRRATPRMRCGDAPAGRAGGEFYDADEALRLLGSGSLDRPAHPTAEAMVEQDGIEPTTSCLQSTRSPN